MILKVIYVCSLVLIVFGVYLKQYDRIKTLTKDKIRLNNIVFDLRKNLAAAYKKTDFLYMEEQVKILRASYDDIQNRYVKVRASYDDIQNRYVQSTLDLEYMRTMYREEMEFKKSLLS